MHETNTETYYLKHHTLNILNPVPCMKLLDCSFIVS